MKRQKPMRSFVVIVDLHDGTGVMRRVDDVAFFLAREAMCIHYHVGREAVRLVPSQEAP